MGCIFVFVAALCAASEAAQFQAMAHKLELFTPKYPMDLHGGSAPTAELDALDGEEAARLLIDSGSGWSRRSRSRSRDNR